MEQAKLFGIKYFTQDTVVLESKFILIDGLISNDHLAEIIFAKSVYSIKLG